MSGHSHHQLTHFKLALLFTFGFAIVEAITGWWSGSLTLLGDAGHMVFDSFALIIAAFATWIAQKPPSDRHTYGYARAEVIAAWLSSLLMLAAITAIIIEAIERFQNPKPVSGGAVIIVALIGLIINIVVAWVLSLGERTLNVRAAILHVISDILGSVAALISGTVIFFSHWTMIDPILSLFICCLILYSTIKLLRESLLVLMEGVPKHLSVKEIKQAIKSTEGVCSIHDLHIWTLTSGIVLLTAHLKINSCEDWDTTQQKITSILNEKFSIDHITLQPEINPTRCALYKK